MSAVLDEETTTVVLEGLDFDVPCIVADDHAADLLIECRFCPSAAYHCGSHWREKRQRADLLFTLGVIGSVYCDECRTHAASVDELVKVVPL